MLYELKREKTRRVIITSMKDKAWELIQFTDTHYFGGNDGKLLGVDTKASFEATAKLALEKHKSIDAVLLTGDLSQDQTLASYNHLSASVASLQVSCYFLPGNHDNPKLLKSMQAKNIKQEQDFVLGNWQIILLDTSVPNKVYGYLSKDELKRLNAILLQIENVNSENSVQHSIVCLHHHPILVGSKWTDEIGLRNADEFFQIIDMYKSIKAILFGHVHQEFNSTRNNIQILCAPSTCVQFEPMSNNFTVGQQASGFRYLKLYESGKIETKIERLSYIPEGLEINASGY
jgi:Icc protein